jgi:chitin disaccharide deacetylase
MAIRPRPRTRRVIFTADDFGMALSVNEAIERAHRDGVLGTASLMAGGDAVADAVERARRLPGLRVGLHVTLVNGRPLLPPEQVPDLVDGTGRLLVDLPAAGVRFFFRPGIRRQLEAEIRAQFEAFRATGLRLDHVNAHSHMHVHPTIFGLLLRIGRDYGNPPLRIPREPFVQSWRATRRDLPARLASALLLAPWFGLMTLRARNAGVAYNDFVFGMNDTGRMTRERVVAFLRELPPGTSELYFHIAVRHWPGMDRELESYALEDEFAALIDPAVAATLADEAIAAIGFADLTRAG